MRFFPVIKDYYKSIITGDLCLNCVYSFHLLQSVRKTYRYIYTHTHLNYFWKLNSMTWKSTAHMFSQDIKRTAWSSIIFLQYSSNILIHLGECSLWTCPGINLPLTDRYSRKYILKYSLIINTLDWVYTPPLTSG